VEPKPKYLSVSDLFRNARPTTLFQEVQRQLEEEREKNVLDKDLLRQQEDWSILAHQVVGGEARGSGARC